MDYRPAQTSLISIHLMLRFISMDTNPLLVWDNFNTSHVKVYPLIRPERELETKISIHLMLRFIKKGDGSMLDKFNFNTSHVKVYLHHSYLS